MENGREKLAELLSSLERSGGNDISRATSPGGEPQRTDTSNGQSKNLSRSRPRTYPYFLYLPYQVESEAERQESLEEITKQLYMAVEAGDFAPGALHWTRELRAWLGLKFDPTKEQRVKLVRLYYELALAPGIDVTASERFASMFMILTKYASFLDLVEQQLTESGASITFDPSRTLCLTGDHYSESSKFSCCHQSQG